MRPPMRGEKIKASIFMIFVLISFYRGHTLRSMPDKYSPKPRIVVYLDPKEMAAAEKKAKAADHKNAHRWGTAVIRKALK